MQPNENPESISPLQAHLNTLQNLPLLTTIEAIHTLLPHLTPSISPTGTRLVSYTPNNDTEASTEQRNNLTGYGTLDTLGRIYLKCADRCTREHAPFKTRLLHTDLDPAMEEIYSASHDQLMDGLKDGSVKIPPPDENEVQMCACCRGDPDATILMRLHEGIALYFWENEYKDIFGDEKNSGGMYGSEETLLMASREQVERKAREVEEGLSKL